MEKKAFWGGNGGRCDGIHRPLLSHLIIPDCIGRARALPNGADPLMRRVDIAAAAAALSNSGTANHKQRSAIVPSLTVSRSVYPVELGKLRQVRVPGQPDLALALDQCGTEYSVLTDGVSCHERVDPQELTRARDAALQHRQRVHHGEK